MIEAAVEAAKLRLRPILMTSFAFIFGVLPLVFATGAGASARKSIGIAVASGMLSSTILGLIFVVLVVALKRGICGEILLLFGRRRDLAAEGAVPEEGGAAEVMPPTALALPMIAPAATPPRTPAPTAQPKQPAFAGAGAASAASPMPAAAAIPRTDLYM